MYVDLACSACGSRLLEAVWSSATVSQRQSIAERLGEQTCVNTPYIRRDLVRRRKMKQAALSQSYSPEKDEHSHISVLHYYSYYNEKSFSFSCGVRLDPRN